MPEPIVQQPLRESRIAPFSPMPGIALSGYGMDEDIRKSRAAGFVEHFVKPVDLKKLREAIERLASS